MKAKQKSDVIGVARVVVQDHAMEHVKVDVHVLALMDVREAVQGHAMEHVKVDVHVLALMDVREVAEAGKEVIKNQHF